jgi:hypothetical protein
MKRRHQELRRMTDQATAQIAAQPDLQALMDLPRAEEQLRAAWQSWSLETRRTWIKRLLDRIEVKPAGPARGPASDVESRLSPVWRI